MQKKASFKNTVLKPAFRDARGEIFDLIEEKVGHVGLITFVRGAVRANHYHIRSTQYSYVLEGKIKLMISRIDGTRKKEYILGPGTLSSIPPKMVHKYTALTKAKMLDITTLSRNDNGYEKDTVRVSKKK